MDDHAWDEGHFRPDWADHDLSAAGRRAVAKLETGRKWSQLSQTIEIALPCAVILVLHLIDNLFNGFANSIYPLLAGGLASLVLEIGSDAQDAREDEFFVFEQLDETEFVKVVTH